MNHSSLRFEGILRAAIPDLDGMPLYVALTSEGLWAEFTKEGVGGYANPMGDLALREWLGDRWRGRGPAVVTDDLALARLGPEDPPSMAGRNALAVVIHEMAHQLDYGLKYPEVDDPKRFRQASDNIREWAVAVERPEVAPFVGHSATWVRYALHLTHRVRGQGYSVDYEEVLHTYDYSLSRAADYFNALEPELFLCSSHRLARFEDIVRYSPPDEFVALWRSDVLRWLVSLGDNPSDEETQAAQSHIAIYPRARVASVEEAATTRLIPYSDCRVRVPM